MEIEKNIFYILEVIYFALYLLIFFTSFSFVEKTSFNGNVRYDIFSTIVKNTKELIYKFSFSYEGLTYFIQGLIMMIFSFLFITFINVFISKGLSIPINFILNLID